MTEDQIIGFFMFISGACIGSFLNVCIVRLPHEHSVVLPGSQCPTCQHMIPWYDNIPFLSYLVLKGRCRFCQARISFRYFFVEFLTAVTFLVYYLYFGKSVILFPYLCMTSGFIVATFVDFKHRIIPDEVSVYGMYAGMVFSVFIPQLHDTSFVVIGYGRILMFILVGICVLGYFVEFVIHRAKFDKHDLMLLVFIFALLAFDFLLNYGLPAFQRSGARQWLPYLQGLDASIIGVLVGGGLIYAMGMLGDFLFKKESMGGGDVKLMAMMGAFLGWKLALLAFFIAPFFGAVFGVVEKLRTKDTAIAYGPFLVLGALISLFYGEVIIQWLLNRHGI